MREDFVTTVRVLKETLAVELVKESGFSGLQLGEVTATELDTTLDTLLSNLSIDIITRLPVEIIQALIVGARRGAPHEVTLAYMLSAPVSVEACKFVTRLFYSSERKLH